MLLMKCRFAVYAKYAIVDMTEGDQFLLENLKSKGAYGASAAPPKN